MITTLTGIRALAAGWVVLHHFRDPVFDLLPRLRFLEPPVRAGYLGVEVFFVLSGFIIAYNYAERMRGAGRGTARGVGFGKYLWARAARIYPVHLATMLLMIPLCLAFWSEPDLRTATPANVVGNVFMLQALPGLRGVNGPSWSVSCEFAAYLVFPLLAAWALRLSARAALVCAGTVLVVGTTAIMAAASVAPSMAVWITYPLMWLRIAVGFSVGVLLWRWWANPRNGRGRGSEAWDLAAIGGVLGTLVITYAVDAASPAAMLALPFIALFVISCASATGPVARLLNSAPMQWGGRISYSLYMSHYVIFLLLKQLVPWKQYQDSPLGVRLLLVVVMVPWILGTAAVVYHFVEEPARKRAMAWWARRHGDAAPSPAAAPPPAEPPAPVTVEERTDDEGDKLDLADLWRRYAGLVISLGAYLVYTWYSLTRVTQHLAAGYDLGIFDQAVRHYAAFQPPIVALAGPDYNLLGNHFHPIIAAIAPLYWIWDDPRVLLIVQSALIAVSVWVVHRYARRHLGPATADLVTLAYAVGWPLQAMADFDFHEVAFAVPLLAVAIDALDRRSDRALLLACAALLLVREDMGLVVFCLGLLRVRRAPRWPAAVLMLVGPLVFLVVTRLVIPALATDGRFRFWSYDALGPDLPSALGFALTHPLSVVALLFTPAVKTGTLIFLFAPVLFLALRSPLVLPTLPLIAASFLSSRENLWEPHHHYAAVIWPIIFLAFIDGARRLGLPDRKRVFAAVTALVLSFPLVGTVSGSIVFPLHRMLDGQAFVVSKHMRNADEVIDEVPADTCVVADDRLASALTRKNLVFVNVSPPRRPADFLLIDTSVANMDYGPDSKPAAVRDRALAAGYTEAAKSGSVLLLRRPGYAGPSAECRPTP
jgi:peptidoglycan/LPS O-acetylase OafA/YrhL/uncharacterized membrane protein